MSQETSQWLNTQTLIGFTDKRGTAWHYRIEDQGAEPNHYPMAIPTEDVLRRLFNFEVVEQQLEYEYAGVLRRDGRKLMIASDNGDLLGVFKAGYQGHDYKEWLVNNVQSILGDELGIGSAGLLRNRGQAWVSVEVPESITTPEGVEFRPHLTACTSFDGTLATTYKRHVTVVVCDNTLAAGMGESGQQYKVRHTKYSNVKIADAREALAIVYTMADDFAAEVKQLTEWEVSDEEFNKLLDLSIPLPNPDADKKREETMRTKKREEITALYANHPASADYKGTAWGVLQAFNTYNHHVASVRKGTPRVVRNMEKIVRGSFEEADDLVLKQLALVTA